MIVCAGFQGRFALDDAYCAGRIVDLLDGEVTDAAKASAILARSFPTAWDAIMARTYGPPGLEEDIEFCAQENTIDVVPRFSRMVDGAAEIVLAVRSSRGEPARSLTRVWRRARATCRLGTQDWSSSENARRSARDGAATPATESRRRLSSMVGDDIPSISRLVLRRGHTRRRSSQARPLCRRNHAEPHTAET